MRKNLKTRITLLLSLLLLNINCQVQAETRDYQFPDGFLWGTATAAYQVEGGIVNDWSTNGLDAGKAAEHYQKFEEDFRVAREMNNNAYRFSIEWARIEPEEGEYDYNEIEHYKDVLASLREKGLKPMVT